MEATILVSRSLWETSIARLEHNQLVEYHVERASDISLVGHIFKGKVSRVLPGMQAAFIEIGLERTGFLYVSHVVDPDQKKEASVPAEIEDEDPSYEESYLKEEDSEEDSEILESELKGKQFPEISKLLSEGQELMVQVNKEPMGTKGSRLTGYVSIPGRFLVYIPESDQLGISRRIEDPEERDRLEKIITKHKPKSGGLIVRTVAEGASEKHIKDDLDFLLKLWTSIKKSFSKQKKPGLLYADLDLSMRLLRDRVTEEVTRVIVDDEELYKKMNKFVQSFLPRFKNRIELHSENTSLLEAHGIDADLGRSLQRKVWLKSGGYIIIEETEALCSIDVNTGRFVGKRNLEDTILKTNIEALKEVAYQIRLRNIGGIIIVDFIDMEKEQHRERVYESFLEELKKDPVRSNVLPMSELGLIQMTRKRTQESLRKKLTSTCKVCEGRGYLKSRKSIAYEIFHECEKEARQNKASKNLTVYCHPLIAAYCADEASELVEGLEQKLEKHLSIKVDAHLHLEDYEIFAKGTQ